MSGVIPPAYANRTLSVHVEFWKQFPQTGVINGSGQSVFSDYTKVTENTLVNKQGLLSGVVPMDEFWINTIALALFFLMTAGAGAMTNKGFAGVVIVVFGVALQAFGWMPPEINPLSYGFAMVLAILYWFGTSRTKGN